MWMVDIAREQSPTLDRLYEMAALSLDSGYNALGLYLEHRFAYPSTPWTHGDGCVTPDMIRSLQSEFPSLEIVPFINLLGHFEGFIYTEHGKQYREELFSGLQACPANPDFVRLAEQIIDDTLSIFDSHLIHIGGDETAQLGASPASAARIEQLKAERPGVEDGKALLYGAHFGPLAERVSRAGRRPGVWGDMYLEHPLALDAMPKETLIFDWQYFNGLKQSSPKFVERGFEVVGSPAIQTYNASWMHVVPSETNVREVAADVQEMGLHGVCVTTWECGLMGSYDTLFPALKACGDILNEERIERITDGASFFAAYDSVSPESGRWARLMSDGLANCGGTFTPSKIRSSLKVRLLLNANPFLAWMHHADELCGEVGDQALRVCEEALLTAPGEAEQGVTVFVRSAIEFVRMAEMARKEYAAGRTEAAVAKLTASRTVFDELSRVARRTHARVGGSLADIERCRVAKEHIERVMKQIRQYGDGSLGYLPAFEIITHPKFMPHDQACWWLINKWANQ